VEVLALDDDAMAYDDVMTWTVCPVRPEKKVMATAGIEPSVMSTTLCSFAWPLGPSHSGGARLLEVLADFGYLCGWVRGCVRAP
jgi:hypothetical protein